MNEEPPVQGQNNEAMISKVVSIAFEFIRTVNPEVFSIADLLETLPKPHTNELKYFDIIDQVRNEPD